MTPSVMSKLIERKYGVRVPPSQVGAFFQSNEEAARWGDKMMGAAQQMAKGGMVKSFAEGGYLDPYGYTSPTSGLTQEKFDSYDYDKQQLYMTKFPKYFDTGFIDASGALSGPTGGTTTPTTTQTPTTTTTPPPTTTYQSYDPNAGTGTATWDTKNTTTTGTGSGYYGTGSTNDGVNTGTQVPTPDTTYQTALPTGTNTNPAAQTTSVPTYDPAPAQGSDWLDQQYVDLFGRNVGQEGRDYWGGYLESGELTQDQVLQHLQNSPEAGYYRELNSVYQQILGRPIGSEGVDYWIPYLKSGELTMDQVKAHVLASDEANQSGTPTTGTPTTGTSTSDYTSELNAYYNQTLGRGIAQEGLEYWLPYLESGELTMDQVKAHIYESQDAKNYRDTGMPSVDFTFASIDNVDEGEALDKIKATFRNALGRNVDQGGIDNYMAQFRDGRALSEILNEIIYSEESQSVDAQRFDNNKNLTEKQRVMMLNAYANPDRNIFMQEVEKLQAQGGEFIDPNTGQVTGTPTYDPTTGEAATAQTPGRTDTNTYEAQQISDELQGTLGDLEAQTATPSSEATVRGQLEILMDDFEDGTPPWASGAMRQAMGVMQKRGLGASSIAGQAIVQAAMEAALPIAQQDASTFASFEMQNLNNRQQTEIFKAQQRIGALFSDQAAVNAAQQFNASSKNQTDQFFASLEESSSKFNAAQINAMTQVNVDAENAQKQFTAKMEDLRDRFNATNSLMIAQANAQWRQNINTVNTAEQNDANREYAKQINGMTTASLDQLWQRERDLMAFAYSEAQSGLDREMQLLMADKQEELAKWQQGEAESQAKGYMFTKLATDVLFGGGLFD